MPHLEICNCASCFLIRQYEQREFVHEQKWKLKIFLLIYSYFYWFGISAVAFLLKGHSASDLIFSLFPPYVIFTLGLLIVLNYIFAISYLSYLLKPKDALSHIFAISLIYSFFISLLFPKFDLYGFFLCIFILFCLHLACFCVGYIFRVAKNRRLNPTN